ncbi:hypothetical protein [Bartonella phoceensis]|uniref:hypothetical protein n=1 Tax=Bartonella phoceensis TaxID=270249 RepID=UPI001ABBD1D9|nr:hypothetical protein [Bartonella phoceensis]
MTGFPTEFIETKGVCAWYLLPAKFNSFTKLHAEWGMTRVSLRIRLFGRRVMVGFAGGCRKVAVFI